MQIIRVAEVKHTSYNTDTCTLPNIFALALKHAIQEAIVHICVSAKAVMPVL